MKKYSIVIAMVLVLALTVSTFAASFADVPSNHWAYEAVNKLVAAGLIQGYPDGTFKGQNDLTRYEVAVMLARLLNDIEEARAELVDQVDFMVNDALISANSGLSDAEAEEVQAIVAAVIAKNAPEEVVVEAPDDVLTQAEADAVAILVDVLSVEFADELATLGVQVADLEARTAALETVTFSGEYTAKYENDSFDGVAYDDPFNYDGAINTDDNVFKSKLDLNAAINSGPLSADLNLVASIDHFGTNDGSDDSGSLDLDTLSAIITGPEFKATIKEEQNEKVRDYLFAADVDEDDDDEPYYHTYGLKLETMGNTYLLTGDKVISDYYAFAGTDTLSFLNDINLVYGYESNMGDSMKDDDDVFGLYKTFVVGEFDVTPELAFSNTDFDQYYFTLGATGDLGPVATTFNYKNIADEFRVVYADEADINEEDGFDIKGEASFGIVDVVGYHENYIAADDTFTYLEGTVTEENGVNVAGYNVFGEAAYRDYSEKTDAYSEKLYVSAKNSYGNLDVLGKVEYQDTTDNFWTATEDFEEVSKDDGNVEDRVDKYIEFDYKFSENLTGGANYAWDKDMDMDEHQYLVDYAQGIFTAGAQLDIDTDEADKETHIYAGLNADKAESYGFMAVDYTPYALYKAWFEEDVTNVLVGVDAEKTVSEYATLTAGLELADYEKDDDFTEDDDHSFLAGTLVTAKAGASYAITEDVTATAGYKHLDFDGDIVADDYKAEEITAEVSVKF